MIEEGVMIEEGEMIEEEEMMLLMIMKKDIVRK